MTRRDETICSLHGDMVKVFEEIKKEMEFQNIQQAKIENSLKWVTRIGIGLLGISSTVLLAFVPFVASLNTRVTVLEKLLLDERAISAQQDNRTAITSHYNITKR